MSLTDNHAARIAAIDARIKAGELVGNAEMEAWRNAQLDSKPIPPPEVCQQIAAEMLAEMNMEEKLEAGEVTDDDYSLYMAGREADGDFRGMVKHPFPQRSLSRQKVEDWDDLEMSEAWIHA
jgi:hypothetical protein